MCMNFPRSLKYIELFLNEQWVACQECSLGVSQPAIFMCELVLQYFNIWSTFIEKIEAIPHAKQI